MIDEVINSRRSSPPDDFVTGLVKAEEDGDRLNRDELRVMLVNMILANETARSQMGCTFSALARHPEQWQELAAAPDTVAGAAEETLRWEPAVDYVPRLAKVAVEVEDEVFEPGTWIELSLMSANRDASAFDDPDRFDIYRAGEPVLSFGGGIHHCVGAALSRTGLQEAIGVLTQRFPALSAAGEGEWRNVIGGNRCFKSLPLVFDRP
jgi:cytochrome P450